MELIRLRGGPLSGHEHASPERLGCTQLGRSVRSRPSKNDSSPKLLFAGKTTHVVNRDAEKAPLGVRLRVIFGSAIVLWVLLIWGIGSLIKLMRYGLN